MRYQAILFDKDGTLFDFQSSWGRWARQLIDHLDDDPSARQALADEMLFDYQAERFLPQSPIIAGTSDEIVAAIGRALPDMAEAAIIDQVRQSVANAKMYPVADLPAILGALRARGIKLGLATNDSEAGAWRHLEQNDLAQYFDFVAGADSGFGAKPHSGMCTGFLDQFGIAPANALMVGDSTHDIRAGRDAGMATMAVLTGVAGRAELRGADHVLPSVADLLEWLDAQQV